MSPHSEKKLLGSKTDLCARARVVCERAQTYMRERLGLKTNPKNHETVIYCCLLASGASAIISTSLTLNRLLVAFKTKRARHPHSSHSNFGESNPK